jgi:hypothetical protein
MGRPPDDAAQQPPQDAGEPPGKRRRVNWSQLLVGSGIAAAIIAGLFAVFGSSIRDFLFHGPAPGPHVQVVVTVRSYAETHSRPGLAAVPRGPETVNFKVLNTGNRVAYLTNASIVVQQFIARSGFGGSHIAGYVGVSHRYDVPMPRRPFTGQTIDVPLSQRASADGVDNFDLRFTLRDAGRDHIYLYRVQISLMYGSETLPVEALISLPRDPGIASRCSGNADSQFCRFLRLSGYRSPAMAQLTAR